MKRSIIHNALFALTAVVCLVGCSNQVALTGTVTYTDGTPVQVGQVAFANEKHMFRGQIGKDGFYRLGGNYEGDGIMPGAYSVYLLDTETAESDETGQRTWFIKHVAQKYTAPETSGLTCEVKGRMVFDFQVERP